MRALTEVTLLAVPADALLFLLGFIPSAAFKALGVEQTRAVLSAFSALGEALGRKLAQERPHRGGGADFLSAGGG